MDEATRFDASKEGDVIRLSRTVLDAIVDGSPVHITMTVEGGACEDTIVAARTLLQAIEAAQRTIGHEVEASVKIKGGLA